jgi:hypothetical protein
MVATAFASLDGLAVTPRATRWIDASTVALGNGVGGASHVYNAGRTHNNHFLRFGGAQFLVAPEGVYRSVDDCQTWVQVLSFGGVSYSEGIFVCHSQGVPRLAVVSWPFSAAGVLTCYGSLTGLSGSWSTTTAPGTCLVGANGKAVVLGDTVYGIVQDNGGTPLVANFNPFAPVIGVTSAFPTGWFNGEYFVVWDDVVYAVGRLTGSASGQLGITKFVGTVATLHAMIDSTGTPDYCINPYHVAAWVDPSTGNLVALARSNAAGAWRAFDVTPGLTVTSRTATMLTGGAFAGFGALTKIAGVVFDQNATPGSAPPIYLMAASDGSASGNVVSQFRNNGVAALIGDGLGAANSTGGSIGIGIVNQNVGGERFFSPRFVGGAGTPEIHNTGIGALVVSGTRRKLKSYYPRSQVLATIGGAPATHDLSTTPLAVTPIQPGSVTIRGVIAAVTVVAQDNGAGVFPVSALLPAGGTVVYATGAMTGVTAVLDATTQVEGLSSAGTASLRVYRSAAATEYPAAAVHANLSSPSHGTISGGNQNDGVPGDGTECQVTVAMLGFTPGDRINLQPYVE